MRCVSSELSDQNLSYVALNLHIESRVCASSLSPNIQIPVLFHLSLSKLNEGKIVHFYQTREDQTLFRLAHGTIFPSHSMAICDCPIPWDSNETSNKKYIISCARLLSSLYKAVAKTIQSKLPIRGANEHWVALSGCHLKRTSITLYLGFRITTPIAYYSVIV